MNFVAGSANSLNSPSTVTPPRNKLGLMLAKSESNSPLTPESKQGSPFYAEPADSIAQNAAIIPRRRPRNNPATNKYRHSEPGWLQTPIGSNPNQLHPIDWEETEETEDKTPLISSSVDNLAKRLGTKEVKKIPRAKPVQPPKIDQDEGVQRHLLGCGLQLGIYRYFAIHQSLKATLASLIFTSTNHCFSKAIN